MANDNRRQMLLLLKDGEKTPTEMAKSFEFTLPAVSTHLRVLKDADLVSERISKDLNEIAIPPCIILHFLIRVNRYLISFSDSNPQSRRLAAGLASFSMCRSIVSFASPDSY